jgi:hypothetical protein
MFLHFLLLYAKMKAIYILGKRGILFMFAKNPNLTYTTVFPRRVTSARMTQKALSLVDGTGDAVLLGGFGEASVLLDFDCEIVGCLTMEVSCDAPARIRVNYDEEA